VRSFLGELYGPDLHAKRVDALAGATLGVIAAASLAVAMIGQALAQARGLVTALPTYLTARRALPVHATRANSCGQLDARLLSPDPEGLGAGIAVLSSGHQMSPRTEVAIDHRVE
jgi:hypothetical protein